MTFSGWLTIFLFVAVLTLLAMPLGRYMAAVYTGEHTFLDPLFRTPERLIYRLHARQPGQGPGLEGIREEPDHLLAGRLAAAVLHPAHADAVELHRAQPDGLPLGRRGT